MDEVPEVVDDGDLGFNLPSKKKKKKKMKLMDEDAPAAEEGKALRAHPITCPMSCGKKKFHLSCHQKEGKSLTWQLCKVDVARKSTCKLPLAT